MVYVPAGCVGKEKCPVASVELDEIGFPVTLLPPARSSTAAAATARLVVASRTTPVMALPPVPVGTSDTVATCVTGMVAPPVSVTCAMFTDVNPFAATPRAYVPAGNAMDVHAPLVDVVATLPTTLSD